MSGSHHPASLIWAGRTGLVSRGCWGTVFSSFPQPLPGCVVALEGRRGMTLVRLPRMSPDIPVHRGQQCSEWSRQSRGWTNTDVA